MPMEISSNYENDILSFITENMLSDMREKRVCFNILEVTKKQIHFKCCRHKL